MSVLAIDVERDVALLHVSGEPELRALSFARDLSGMVRRGSLVELGGFGDSEAEPAALRPHFALLEIEELSVGDVTTYADGYGGGCFGDSGGPLLTRDESGTPVVLGILTHGSATCQGRDSSTRADLLREWMAAEGVIADGSALQSCNLPTHGRCYGQVAVHCEGSTARGELCSGDRECGWDTTRNTYNCIARGADPCASVSEFGSCEGDAAQNCSRGVLVTSRCGECAAHCVRSPRSGLVGCAME